MKRFSEQLHKKSMLIRLKAVEKDELRNRVVAFMEYHPLPVTERAAVRKVSAMPPFRVITIPALYIRAGIGAFVLLLVIGVPALAEKSVPGDILYPIKVQVTEEIRSSLNRDPYQKVAWETTRLERRITEARQLAKAGKLTPDVQASVLEAVQAQKEATVNEIDSLRTTDAEGASLAQLTYATMLDVQSSVLKADDSASTTAGKSTVALADAIDASIVEVQSKDDTTAVSVDRLQAQLELETTRAYELLQNISTVTTDQEHKDIERRLSDVDHKIELATKDTTEDAETRQTELRSAWSDVQKLISFMTDIDVRGALAIETLVPVVPTDSERLALITQHTETASNNLLRVEQGIEAVKNPAVLTKINLSMPQAHDFLEQASTSVHANNLDAAESAATEALDLTTSMLSLATFPDIIATTSVATGTPAVVETATTTAASSTPSIGTTTATGTDVAE
jgi:hypothetical protein